MSNLIEKPAGQGRFTRQQWMHRGLQILTDVGPDELKVDRLCKRLGLTKGSFYHHFKNRGDYVLHLMEYWKQKNTLDIIDKVEAGEDKHYRASNLSKLTLGFDIKTEVAIRSWSRLDEVVLETVQSVDKIRTQYISQLIVQEHPKNSKPELLSKLIYAHFVGMQHLAHLMEESDWADMDRFFSHVIQTGGDALFAKVGES